MPKEQLYPVNPDRTQPWNDLPLLPIAPALYRDVDIYDHLTGHGIYAENTARNYLNELADLQIL